MMKHTLTRLTIFLVLLAGCAITDPGEWIGTYPVTDEQ